MNIYSRDDIRKMSRAMKQFDDEHTIADIVLLGEDGAVTRIVMGEPKRE